MFRRLGLVLLAVLSTGGLFTASAASSPLSCRGASVANPKVDPALRPAIRLLQRLPEGRALLNRAQAEGPIRFERESRSSGGFAAYWEGGSARKVCVMAPEQRSLGSVVRSLVFELHNAVSNRRLVQLTDLARNGRLTVDDYVEGVERMEYQNACCAAQLLTSGVRQGIFPKDCSWEVLPNFEDHYKLQQVSGHSLWIADHYTHLTGHLAHGKPYRGTVPGLHRLSGGDKREISRYLAMKAEIEQGRPETRARCREILGRELRQSERQGDAHRLHLMQIAFESPEQLNQLRA